MPSFKLGDPALEKWVSEKVRAGVKRGILSAAVRAVGVIQNELIPAASPQPVDTDAYRGGWRVEETDRGADIVNDLPYASVIEYGARPENIKIGRAMIKALAEWAKRKGFVPDGVPKGGDPGSEYESIAWAIAVSMKKKGIFVRDGVSGLRIAEKAVKRVRDFLQEEVNRELRR
jgi:hypothetical protein